MANSIIEKPGLVRSGTCRWVSDNPRDALLCGGCTALIVETTKGVETTYLVRLVEGGYTMERTDTGKTYTVEMPFSDCREWTCDCPDTTYRSGPGGCKHVRSLFAALNKIGL